jgi:hypothetical protein
VHRNVLLCGSVPYTKSDSMDINLGPAFLRFYSGSNWSHLELGVATNPNGTLARRESAIAVGFKSEHALEVFSVENPADRYIAPDGTITHGRICVQGKRTYSLSAEQVFSAALHKRTLRAARERAEQQAQQELVDALLPAIEINTPTTPHSAPTQQTGLAGLAGA